MKKVVKCYITLFLVALVAASSMFYSFTSADSVKKYIAYENFSNPESSVWSYSACTENDSVTDGWWSDNEMARIEAVDTDMVSGKPALKMTTHSKGQKAVLTFTAPKSGTIEVSMANGGVYAPYTNSSNQPKNAVFAMLHNTTVVTTVQLDQSVKNCFTKPITLEVKAGDVVRFTVDRLAANLPNSYIYLNPEISYKSKNVNSEKYNAYKDFSTKNNPNGVWSYQICQSDTYSSLIAISHVFTKLPFDQNSKKYGNSEQGTFSLTNSDPVTKKPALKVEFASNKSLAVVFTAPQSGKISISMENGGIFTPDNGLKEDFDGVNFFMCKESEVLVTEIGISSKNSKQGAYIFNSQEVTNIKKGEKIYFILAYNKANKSDTTYLSPKVEYLSKSNEKQVESNKLPGKLNARKLVYDAYYDFQGEKQDTTSFSWRYMSGSNNGGKYLLEELPWKDDRWGDTTVGLVGATEKNPVTLQPSLSVHSGLNKDPVVTFIAPYSGTIEVSMSNGGVFVPNNGEHANFDGTNFYFYKGSEQLYSKIGISQKNNSPVDNWAFTETMKIQIRKNERLYFIVKPNDNWLSDSTMFCPHIVYTKITNESAVDTAAIPDYIDNFVSKIKGSPADGTYILADMLREQESEWSYYFVRNKKEYIKLNFNGTGWDSSDINAYAQLTNYSWHPDLNGWLCVKFTCPKSGTIKIGMQVPLKMRQVADATDGTILSILSNGELLGKQYSVSKASPEASFEDLETDVYEGQEILFILSCNAECIGDSTVVTPYVKYLNYKDVPKADLENKEDVYEDPTKLAGTLTPVLPEDNAPIKTSDKNVVTDRIISSTIGVAVAVLIAAIIGSILKLKRKKGKTN